MQTGSEKVLTETNADKRLVEDIISDIAYRTLFPGLIYVEKASKRDDPSYKGDDLTIKDYFDPLLLNIGASVGFASTLTPVLAYGATGIAATAVTICGGTVIGAVAAPLIFWNGIGAVFGTFYNARVICRRVARAAKPVTDAANKVRKMPASKFDPRKWSPKR
ncbi:MAG: hypothetical protein PHE27_05370 [Alphaproteobacteria bacterium]|nr:hypothetical protein [Alphaproteobacteria bacterium]